MTRAETERLAIVETNRNNMSNDLNEIKQDIKEIKKIMNQMNEHFISKKVVRWMVGFIVSVAMLVVYIWIGIKGLKP